MYIQDQLYSTCHNGSIDNLFGTYIARYPDIFRPPTFAPQLLPPEHLPPPHDICPTENISNQRFRFNIITSTVIKLI